MREDHGRWKSGAASTSSERNRMREDRKIEIWGLFHVRKSWETNSASKNLDTLRPSDQLNSLFLTSTTGNNGSFFSYVFSLLSSTSSISLSCLCRMSQYYSQSSSSQKPIGSPTKYANQKFC